MLTVAFPEMDSEDALLWSEFRKANSPAARTSIDPHFTLAFEVECIAEQEYVAHVATVAARTPVISFTCRYAMLGADDEDERAYVFLVPDEGYAAISLLHDRLYTGPLEQCLRLDLPYSHISQLASSITVSTQSSSATS